MDRHLQFESSKEKRDWYKNHVLTEEERKKLIEEKFKRMKLYSKLAEKSKHLL